MTETPYSQLFNIHGARKIVPTSQGHNLYVLDTFDKIVDEGVKQVLDERELVPQRDECVNEMIGEVSTLMGKD